MLVNHNKFYSSIAETYQDFYSLLSTVQEVGASGFTFRETEMHAISPSTSKSGSLRISRARYTSESDLSNDDRRSVLSLRRRTSEDLEFLVEDPEDQSPRHFESFPDFAELHASFAPISSSGDDDDALSKGFSSDSLIYPSCSISRASQHRYVTALYDFQGDIGNFELQFKAGQEIRVISQDESESPGWWRGELLGKVGYFPCNYVTPPC
jgi:hypothetical protein